MTALTDAIDALSPTHYWKLDETTGVTAFDSGSGTAVDLTHLNSPSLAISGPTASDVAIGYDGVDQDSRATISGAASLGTSNTGTMLHFIKYDAGGQQRPISLTRDGNNDPELNFDKTPSSFVRSINVQSSDGSGDPNFRYTANAKAIITGDWNLLAFVHTGDTVRLWVNNGFLPNVNSDFTSAGGADGTEWFDDAAYSILTSFNLGSTVRVATAYYDCDISNVAYFDGVQLSEEDLAEIYDIFVDATAPPTLPVVTNTFAATLDSFGPSHWWRMREGFGDILDTGSVGALDLVDDTGPRNTWRRAPGPIRGVPREFALWGNQNIGSGLERVVTSGLPATGFSTGVLGAVVYVNSTNNEIIYLVNQVYNNDSNHILELTIELDGSIRMRAGDGTDRITAVTAAAVIVDSTPHVIVGVQRGDGTGIRIYDNGVDITLSNSLIGTATLDSFPDDVLAGETGTDLGIGSFDGNPSGGAIISNPFVFVNSVISTANISTLTDSAQLTQTNMSDYFEQVFLLADTDGFTFWFAGWVYDANKDSANPAIDIIESDGLSALSFNGGAGTYNNPELGGVGAQIISEFRNYYYRFGPSDILSTATYLVIDAADTVGTWNFIGKIAESANHKIIMQYGNGQVIGANATNMSFFIGLPTAEYQWGVRLQQSTGNFYQALSTPTFVLDADAITMFTVVQDGIQMAFYVDGNPIAITETQSGTVFEANDWFERVDAATGTDNLQVSARVGNPATQNFEPNEIHDLWNVRRAFTADEISTLWDAVNGIFPAVGPPITGLFGDQLLITQDGPDHWWRMNAAITTLTDVGKRKDRAIDPISGSTIDVFGDPTLEQPSPLPLDTTAKSILFDGVLDAFEVGVNGAPGSLIDNSEPSQTGSIGFFFLPTALKDANIVYSQGDTSYESFLQVGFNQSKLEVIVQRSANNKVTVTSGSSLSSTLFNFIVVTCNGSDYVLYLNGREDSGASVATQNSGTKGDWFRAIASSLSALSAKGITGFTTETTGNVSEVFIYDPAVLTPEEVVELFDAAVEDGFEGQTLSSFHRTGISSSSHTMVVFDSEADA